MDNKNFFKSLRVLYLAAMVTVLILGCHSYLIPYQGQTVSEKNQIRLDDGKDRFGSWQSEDVIVEFSYTKTTSLLSITGFIDFDDSLKNSYTSLEHFFLWLHLIDAENKIVGFKRIDQKILSNPIEKAPFHAEIELSPGVKAMTFSYSGKATEHSEDGSLMTVFWKLPDDK